MDKSSLEQKIKDRLAKHTEPVDNDVLFTALGIAPKKKKKRFILFIFLFLGLMGMAGFGLYYGAGAPKEMAYVQNETNKINEVEKPESVENTTSKGLEESKIQKSSNESTDNSSEKTNNDKQNENLNLNESRSNQFASGNQEIKENQANLTVKLPTNSVVNTKKSIETSLVQTNPDKIVKSPSEIIAYEASKKDDDSKVKETKITESEITQSRSAEILAENLARKLLAITNLEPSVYEVNGQNGQEIAQEKFNFVGELYPVELVQVLKEKAAKEGEYYLSTYVAYDKFKSDLSAKLPMDQEYVQLRKNTERALENVSIGLALRRDLNQSFYVTAGLEYSQYNYEFRYTESIYNEKSDTGLVRVEINYVGDTSLIEGALSSQEETLRRWTVYNNLIMINMPINMAYEYTYNKWSYFAETGLTLGLLSQYQGRVFHRSSELIDGKQLYRISPNLSYNLGLGVTYTYNNSSALQLKMRYRQNLLDISSTTNPLKENIKQVGLELAYVYRL